MTFTSEVPVSTVRTKLFAAWKKRMELYRTADRYLEQAARLKAVGKNYQTSIGDGMNADAKEIAADAAKLTAKADKLWSKALTEVYGEIATEWTYPKHRPHGICKLGNGDVYGGTGI
jgi:hypothetical protein